MTDTDRQRLKRAVRHEAALAEADRAMARALDSAPDAAQKPTP